MDGGGDQDVTYAHVAFDGAGRPVLVMPQSHERAVLSGLDARRANIDAGVALFETLKSSFGPRGADKMIVSQDGDILVTNDGATFLKKIDIDNNAIKMMVDLSGAQDAEIGDGTTGVVLFAIALLKQALSLLNRGISARVVMNGFSTCAAEVVEYISSISEKIEIDTKKPEESRGLLDAVMSTLSSKVVKEEREKFAKLAIKAVASVADFERKDLDLEQIKIIKKVGSTMDKSNLVEGVVIDKGFSHIQMCRSLENPKIAILTCPFEPPKIKTNHKLELSNAEDYKAMQRYEVDVFKTIVSQVKASGADIVLCQWGFDDEANHMLVREQLPAVRWVGGPDIELVSLATGARIVPLFRQLASEKLGTCRHITQIGDADGTGNSLVFEGCPNSKVVTVMLHASNQQLADEVERSFHDALCVARNLMFDNRVVYGGASCELRASEYLDSTTFANSKFNKRAAAGAAENSSRATEMAVCRRAFAEALLEIPRVLAENSVASVADDVLAFVSKAQNKLRQSGNAHWLGIDALGTGQDDMKSLGVVEGLRQKCQQIALAADLAQSVIKIDSIRYIDYEEDE